MGTNNEAKSELPSSARASDVKSGRLLRNTVVNGFANVSTALVTLVLTPFLLSRLGPERYGVWLLALSLTVSGGYLALADLGLPASVVKHIAEARALESDSTINSIVSSALAVFLVVGLVLGVGLTALVSVVIDILKVDATLATEARWVFALVALSIVVDLPAAAFLAVIEGVQRYGWRRAVDICGRLVWAGIVVVAVVRGHGVIALAVAWLCASLVRGALSFCVAHHVVPSLRLRPQYIERSILKKTMSFGSRITVMRGLSTVYDQMDRAIVGVVLGPAAVARYEVAFRVQSVATLAMVVSSSAVMPAAAFNAARDETEKQRELFLRGTKYALAMVLPSTVAAIVFAPRLIVGWVGHDYISLAWPARLFLMYPLLGCLNQVGVAMLTGLGRVRRVLEIRAVAVGVNLAVSMALVRSRGLEGVIIGTLVGNGLAWLPYNWLLLSTFGVDMRTWVRRTIAPHLLPVAAQLVVAAFLIRGFSDNGALWLTAGLCGLSALAYIGTFAAVGLSPGERRHLMSRLRSG